MIIGQEKIKNLLRINLTATQAGVFPHTLFVGGFGMGKTTLALFIAGELKKSFVPSLGSALTTADEMIKILTKMQDHSVLFIDEIHSLNSKAEEVLYIAMENGVYYSDGVEIKLPAFTLLGATTKEELLSKPLKSRFQLFLKLSDYTPQEIGKIITGVILGANKRIKTDALRLLVRASRLNPRGAINLSKTVCNYAVALKKKEIDFFLTQKVLTELNIDHKGLNGNDHLYLRALKTFRKAIGLATLSAYTQLSQKTIREDIEPNLIRKGLVNLTKQGRSLVKHQLDNNLFQ